MGQFTGKLKFVSLNRTDSGSIKCRAFNEYGAGGVSVATLLDVKCELVWCQLGVQRIGCGCVVLICYVLVC